MANKILFIDTTHEILEKELESMGFEIHQIHNLDYDGYLDIADRYFGIVIRNRIRLDKKFLENARKLQFIARAGSGLENIDTACAIEKGIKCINSPEGNRDSLGEHTIGMLLCMFHRINLSADEVKSLKWRREENRGEEIMGKTIGIIGYGNMGGAFARRLNAFDVNVIAYDKYKKDFSDEFVKEVDMQEIIRESDILSLHIPLTEETNNLVCKEYIDKFEKDIYLINTSRGKVVNTPDLVYQLKSGKIKGAILDVLEYESDNFEALNKDEIPDDLKYILKSEKVLLTPHVAGYSRQSKYKLAKVLADKIRMEFNL
jgi:D-3-phosphoglycerate dehydrogenase